jgi:threonine dehydrogenase-like Zn-dependent dehydrogenase
MRALVLGDEGVTLRTDWPDPRPAPGEVLVEVLRAGICETDLQLIRGYHGFRGVLGHEFVGIPLGGAFEGQRVAGEINCSCWTCETCLAGRARHCPHRTVLGILKHDGAFADFVAVPEPNLHAVPDAIDSDAAVFIEPLAAAFQIPAQLAISRDDRVIVLGDGRLGNLCAQVLSGLSDHVVVIGKHRQKLDRLNALGIDITLLDDRAAHAGADVVVDCTGSETGIPMAIELVRPRGTIVLKTTIAGTQELSLAPIVVDEITIVGSRCGPFDVAIDALANGLVEVAPLISDTFDLSDGLRALARAAEPGVMKVLLDASERRGLAQQPPPDLAER